MAPQFSVAGPLVTDVAFITIPTSEGGATTQKHMKDGLYAMFMLICKNTYFRVYIPRTSTSLMRWLHVNHIRKGSFIAVRGQLSICKSLCHRPIHSITGEKLARLPNNKYSMGHTCARHRMMKHHLRIPRTATATTSSGKRQNSNSGRHRHHRDQSKKRPRVVHLKRHYFLRAFSWIRPGLQHQGASVFDLEVPNGIHSRRMIFHVPFALQDWEIQQMLLFARAHQRLTRIIIRIIKN
ncbi:hypothetical protein BDA99DRAFT_541729 [Phascolomyces articulosus]|uniref:Uncharacterized protein n=1 Tax=Phascolomyces articulosus TaxID=60185 RepID=A0AAD5P9M3_9FUNG|nr:hypothetical protein BDA99DRAFT_541729 [Phascolomyces articulosus]